MPIGHPTGYGHTEAMGLKLRRGQGGAEDLSSSPFRLARSMKVSGACVA